MSKSNINRILKYFKKNIDIFNKCIEELNCYVPLLGDECYYNMDDFDLVCSRMTPMEVANRIIISVDEGSDAAFNTNRKYFRFTCDGRFISSDKKRLYILFR